MSKHWTLDDIPWQAFDPDKVDPDILTAIKAASMVEQDSDDYVAYLCRVFHDDADFRRAARAWGDEELQHGQALGRWAALADPSFDFARSFARYTEEHQLPLDATESVRGSRSTELIARCMVEVGTSLFYSAVRDATEEPVLKAICRHIAKDEVRHYKLFYSHGQRYLARERPLLITRLKAAFASIAMMNSPTPTTAASARPRPTAAGATTKPMRGGPFASIATIMSRALSPWCSRRWGFIPTAGWRRP